MSHLLLATLAVLVALAGPCRGARAGELKAGWTAQGLASETADCTKTLVQGAWKSAKREHGVDPGMPLAEEVMKEIEPQIASMRKICACAVRAGAERYTRWEADRAPVALDRFVADTIARGACKHGP